MLFATLLASLALADEPEHNVGESAKDVGARTLAIDQALVSPDRVDAALRRIELSTMGFRDPSPSGQDFDRALFEAAVEEFRAMFPEVVPPAPMVDSPGPMGGAPIPAFDGPRPAEARRREPYADAPSVPQRASGAPRRGPASVHVPAPPPPISWTQDEDDEPDHPIGPTRAAVVAVGQAGAWHCSGTLISPRLVLTAAHCATSPQVLVTGPAGLLGGGHSAGVVSTQRHPVADVALLVLDRDVNVDLPIWRHRGQSSPPMGTLFAVGHGRTAGNEGAGGFDRRDLLIPVASWGCIAADAALLGCNSSFEMTLSGWGTPDTCVGDSGGPLFEVVGAGARLVGVTSRALGTARVDCGDGGVYTRVDVIADWLSNEISKRSN